MSDPGSERSLLRPASAPLVLGVLAVLGVLTVLALLVVLTDPSWQGPVVLEVTTEHGVHLVDVPVLVAWALGVAGCVRLLRRG